MNRAFRAGETIEDYCRACKTDCKTDRLHTIIVVDDTGRPIRVSCDYCDSQRHNFRGPAKWRGGTLVLRPSMPGLQEKRWPIETFFHRIVMLRNRLRTLEQRAVSWPTFTG